MEIFYSKNRRVLSKYIREAVHEHNLNEPFSRGFFIVPETEKANMERLYFSENSERSLMLEEILSFKRFALRIAELAGGGAKATSNPALEIFLLAKAIKDIKDDLSVLEKMYSKTSYLLRIKDIIGDFWRNEISTAELLQVSEILIDNNEPALANKLKDLALIMEKFEEVLKIRNLAPSDLLIQDLSDRLWDLYAILSENGGDYSSLEFPYNQFEFLEDTSIWIYGFGISRTFTPQEMEIIKVLNLLCKNLVITAEADMPPNSFEDLESAKLCFRAGRQLLFDFSRLYPDAKFTKLAEIDRKTRYEFHVFKTDLDESRYVAGKIKQILFENKNLQAKDIAIALASSSQQLNMRLALEELGLPYYTQDMGNLDYALLENYLHALFEFLKYPDDFNLLIAYLKNSYTGLSPEEQDELIDFYYSRAFSTNDVFNCEKYLEEYKPGKLAELSAIADVDYDYNLNDVESELFVEEQVLSNSIDKVKVVEDKGDNATLTRGERALELAKQVVLPLRKLVTFYKKDESTFEFSRAFIDFFKTINLESKLKKNIQKLLDDNLEDEAEVDAKAWNNLLNTLALFSADEQNMEMNFAEFIFYMETAFEESNSNRIPASGNQIILGNILQIAKENVDVIFLLSASHANIPSKKNKISLVNNVDRIKINSYLDKALQDTDLQLLTVSSSDLYSIINLANQLIVSYTGDIDEESYEFATLRKSRGLELVEHDRIESLYAPELALAERAWAVINSEEGRNLNFTDSELQDLRGFLELNNPQIIDLYENDLSQRQMSLQGELQISPDLLKRLIGKNPLWSISQLEKYRSNPFHFYVEYLLRLKDKKSYKPEAAGFGTLVHKVMEIMQADWRMALDKATNDTEQLDILERILSEIDENKIAEYIKMAAIEDESLKLFFMPGLAYLSRYIALLTTYQGSRAQVIELIKNELNYEPYLSEWNFGRAEGQEFAIEFNLDDKIFLQGFVDRIDIERFVDSGQEAGFRVIDYKTGDKQVSYPDLYYGYDLQLPVYLSAFESLNTLGLKAKDAAYAKLSSFTFNAEKPVLESLEKLEVEAQKSFNLRSLDFDVETLDLLMSHSLNKIKTLSQAIMSGNFSSEPSSSTEYKDPSIYCNYRAMAQLDRGHIRKRVERNIQALALNIDSAIELKGRDKNKAALEFLLKHEAGRDNE